MLKRKQDEVLAYRLEISERFVELYRQLAEKYGLNLTQLADALNVSVSTLHLYKTAKIMPTPRVLYLLSRRYNVNLNWLIAGRGEVFLQPEGKEKKQEKEKRYLVGNLIKELRQHLGLSVKEFVDLSPFESELEVLYIEDNRLEVPESKLVDLQFLFGLKEGWYKAETLQFMTMLIYIPHFMSGSVDYMVLMKDYTGVIFTTECPFEDKPLHFALWLQFKERKFGGFFFYDTTDYAVWNWTEDPMQKACLLRKLLQIGYEKGFSLKIITKQEFQKLTEGLIHPTQAKGITSNLLKELEERSLEDYEQFRGMPSYCLAKLIVEYLYKC